MTGTSRRHPGDALRLALAAVLLTLATLVAGAGSVSRPEADASKLLHDLPGPAAPIALALVILGSPYTAAVFAALAAAARRFRLAVDILLAGGIGYGAASLLHVAVTRPTPATTFVQHGPGRLDLSWLHVGGLGYPSGVIAVAAGVATVASPYLSRPWARAAWTAVLAVAGARLFGSLDLPVDAIGGAAIGWAVGAAIHLVSGAPTGHPPADRVLAALAELGLPVVNLSAGDVGRSGYARFTAETVEGDPVFVKVLGREERSADLLLRTARFAAFRDAEDEVSFASRRRQAEHEALLALIARRDGVTAPTVRLAARSRNGEVVLVEDYVDGLALDEVPPDALTDVELRGVWEEVAALREARMAHRRLRAHAFLLDAKGRVWLTGFGGAHAGADDRHLARDAAELLVSLAALVGPERAVRTATEVLGEEDMVAALPLIQPLALSGATWRDLGTRVGLVGDVRNALSAYVGVEQPALQQITRFRPRSLVALAVLGFAVHVLLPQVGHVHQTVAAIEGASWAWMVVAAAVMTTTFVAAAVAQMGAVRTRLRLWPMTLIQVATCFANRVTPAGTGGLGINERYLERRGIDRSAAVAAVGLNALAGAVVHAIGVFVAIAALGRAGIGGVAYPRGWIVLVVVAGGSALVGIVLISPLGPPLARLVRRSSSDLWHAVRHPAQFAMLMGGSAGVTLGYALALAASLAAFGAHASLVKVIVVYLGGAAVASVSPTPGALGAVEAALLAGLTGVGVAAGPAVAGVLAFRLVTFWLPTLPGLVAFRLVRGRGWV